MWVFSTNPKFREWEIYEKWQTQNIWKLKEQIRGLNQKVRLGLSILGNKFCKDGKVEKPRVFGEESLSYQSDQF